MATKEEKVKSRIGLFCKYDNVKSFLDGIEELKAAVEDGLISKDNIFVKWANPETVAQIESITPNATAKPKAKIGLEQFGDKADAVKAVLNKKASPSLFESKEILAAYISAASVDNYKDLDEKERVEAKINCVDWINANTSNDSDAIFISKRGAGVTLRVTLD
jgi:hypothetical protein